MNLFDKRNSTEHHTGPSAWQNFLWDVNDWIYNHRLLVAMVLLGALYFGAWLDAQAEDKWSVIMHDIYEEVREESGPVVKVEDLPEQCFSPYAPVLYPEFEVQNVGITVHWYDSKAQMQDDLGDLFPDRDYSAASQCEKKPEFNISYCDIYVVRPTMVDDNATLSIGHEVLHGLIGDFHD